MHVYAYVSAFVQYGCVQLYMYILLLLNMYTYTHTKILPLIHVCTVYISSASTRLHVSTSICLQSSSISCRKHAYNKIVRIHAHVLYTRTCYSIYSCIHAQVVAYTIMLETLHTATACTHTLRFTIVLYTYTQIHSKHFLDCEHVYIVLLTHCTLRARALHTLHFTIPLHIKSRQALSYTVCMYTAAYTLHTACMHTLLSLHNYTP